MGLVPEARRDIPPGRRLCGNLYILGLVLRFIIWEIVIRGDSLGGVYQEGESRGCGIYNTVESRG